MIMSGLTRLLLLLVPSMLIIYSFSLLSESSIEEINTIGSNVAFAFVGTLLGLTYFAISEMNMAENNRSYVANPLTDVLAFLGSGWLIVRAFELDEGLLVLVGCSIFSIHVMQLAFKYGFDFDKPGSAFWGINGD